MARPVTPGALLVTDSSALIGLDRVGRLGLLPALYATVIVPRRVAVETGLVEPWMDVREVTPTPLLRLLHAELDPGEAEAIALAATIETCEILIDERKGRRVAATLGLRVVGTLAILIRAKDRGRSARSARRSMPSRVKDSVSRSPSMRKRSVSPEKTATGAGCERAA